MYIKNKPDLNSLAHYGKKGMKWGVINEDKASDNGNKKNSQEINSDILRKNKYAAVVNLSGKAEKKELTPDERTARNEKIKKVAIGVGIGLTVAAAAVLYAKNKSAIDNSVNNALAKLKGKKVSDLKAEIPKKKSYAEMIGMTEAEYNVYKSHGLRVDTKQDAVVNNWVANWASHDIHRYDAISKEAYDTMDNNNLTIKAGQLFHRVTTNSEEVLRDGAYASFEPDDVNRYRAFLPAMWRTNGAGNQKVYSMAMEAVDDIKSPSAKSRIDILKNLLDTDVSFAHACGYRGSISGSSQDYALKYYNRLATGLCDKTSPITQKYLKTVKSLGYNALVDDNDAGRLAKTPMILLDASKSMKVNEIIELTKQFQSQAAESIIPMGSESIESIGNLVQDAGENSKGYMLYVQRFTKNMA